MDSSDKISGESGNEESTLSNSTLSNSSDTNDISDAVSGSGARPKQTRRRSRELFHERRFTCDENYDLEKYEAIVVSAGDFTITPENWKDDWLKNIPGSSNLSRTGANLRRLGKEIKQLGLSRSCQVALVIRTGEYMIIQGMEL